MTTIPRRIPRLTTTLSALAAVPLLVVALAACSPAEEGGSGPEVKSESQVADDAVAWDLAHTSCLRDEGIDIPDASADEGSRAPLTGDVDVMMAAQEKCDASTNADLGPRPVTASEKKESAERDEKMRKSAECLRKKGYNVPDSYSEATTEADAPDLIPEKDAEECGGAGGSMMTVER
jgi:hypothetical protein